jgi:hypothetical protein
MKIIIIIIIIILLIISSKEKIYENFNNILNNKYYDCIISINVHEKLDFLMNQLKIINDNVNLSYAIILNCNDFMFNECINNIEKLPDNVFINDIILNKKTYHGSLLNGIYNNMDHVLSNFEFKYFIIASSRSMFGGNMSVNDLDRIVKIKQESQNHDHTKWHWPSFVHTLLAKYYLEQNKELYNSPHEGLLLTKNGCKKIVEFLENNNEIKNDLFNFNGCVEEFAFQTIAMNSEESFHYIGNGCCEEKELDKDNDKEFMYKVHR